MTGTLINAGAVITGSTIGLLIGAKIPERLSRVLFHGIGLFTIFIGVAMALKTNHYLILVFSIILGSISGELLKIEEGLEKMGNTLKKKIKVKNVRFSEGLVTAFLLYCMGSLTILGAFEEGLGNKPTLLLTKSILDGFAAIALSATFGMGVFFSVIPLLIYQGLLTLFAGFLGEHLTEPIINEMTAVGGIMLMGLGITILDIKKLKVINMLPGLVFAVVFCFIPGLLK